MIKEIFLSFKDTLQQKSRNPFLGTYIIVWLLRNWVLVYTLFYFDKGTSLANRIEKLSSFFTGKQFGLDLVINIGITIVALIISYFLINLSRLIVNFYEKTITPWVYQLTDKSSIVLKATHELVKKERDGLRGKLEKEHEAKTKALAEKDDIESKYNEVEIEVMGLRTDI